MSQRRPARSWRRKPGRRVAVALLAGVVVALVVVALMNLDLPRVGHVLITATPGWLAVALALMAMSLVLRGISWHQVLRAALPDTAIELPWVIRATMIGVLASAVFPGRIGEPSRVIVLSRRLKGRTTRLLAVVGGTVLSQTLINLVALAILLAVTFTNVPLLSGQLSGAAGALLVPLLICVLILAGPRLLPVARRSKSPRVARAAARIAHVLELARQGMVVFARPRHSAGAISSQLLAWVLQWLACYAVLVSLGLQSDGGLVAAAAILLAVNVSAILPATPSNIGVFQAACLVVLAAYEVSTATAIAYGLLLQAVEVLTALALGVPALMSEGVSWSDMRSVAETTTELDLADGSEIR